MNLTIFWLVALIVLAVMEFISLGLTTIWFAGGALVAALASAIGLPIYIQVPLFLSVSILLLIFTRPVAVKYFNKDRARTNVDSIIGQQAIVTQAINNLKAEGQAVINGQEWTARSVNNGLIIEEGTIVEICGINGVKLVVRPWPMMNTRPATPNQAPQSPVQQAPVQQPTVQNPVQNQVPPTNL